MTSGAIALVWKAEQFPASGGNQLFDYHVRNGSTIILSPPHSQSLLSLPSFFMVLIRIC